MGNILIFIAVVVVVLILVVYVIGLICGALKAPYPLGMILQIIAFVLAILAICRRAGWL